MISQNVRRSVQLLVLLFFLWWFASQLAFYAGSPTWSRPSIQTGDRSSKGYVVQQSVELVAGDQDAPRVYVEQSSASIKHGNQNTSKASVSVQVTGGDQGTLKAYVELTSARTQLSNQSTPNVSVQLAAGYQGAPKGYVELPSAKRQSGSFTSKSSPVEEPNASAHIGNQPGSNASIQGHVFSLRYHDQQTACIRNLLSLQCWATKFSFKVVEPFVVNTFFGMPLQKLLYGPSNFLRFSDVYDSKEWNNNYMKPHSFPPFATWEEFLHNSPRHVILVSTPDRKSNCNFSHGQMLRSCSPFLRSNGFTVIRKACLPVGTPFALSLNEVSQRILGKLPLQKEVTVIFEKWRGFVVLGQEQAYEGIRVKKPCNCSRHAVLPPMTKLNLTANPTIKRKAERYVQEVLSGQDYIAVMVRFEYMMNTGLNIDACIRRARNSWNEMKHKTGMNATFLTWDIGKLGSATLEHTAEKARIKSAMLVKRATSLFKTFYASSTTIKEWEDKFIQFSGTSHRAYIAMLQKMIVAHARCLILAGGGTYQQHTLAVYQSMHSKTEWCFETIWKRKV